MESNGAAAIPPRQRDEDMVGQRSDLADPHLQASIEAARMAVWTWDLATGAVRCTNARAIWGIEGTHADDYMAVIHPDDHAAVRAAYEAAMAGEGTYHCEYRVLRPDGRVCWTESRGRVEVGPDGRGRRILAGSFDITDRKKAEQALQESELRHRSLFESANDAIMLIDLASGRYVDWNRRTEELTGYDREELSRMRLGDLAPQEHKERMPERLRRLHERGGLLLDYELLVKGGRRVPVELSVKLVRLNEALLMQVIIRDVRDRRAAEQALRESEERLRLAVEATELGTWDVDVATGTRRWSDEFRSILGLPPDAKPDPALFSTLIHPDDRDWVNARYAAAYRPEQGGRYEAEFRINRADDGRERWVLTTGRIFFDQDGRPTRGIGTIMDVTARRQAEEHLRFLLTELSHRVKNTLAVVQGIANQSLTAGRSLGEARDVLARRLQALAHTHTLLTASEWRGAGLRALLDSELAPYGERTDLSGDDLVLGPRAALMLGLVLHELATNAAKHGALSRPEGRIKVSWRIVRDDPPPVFHLLWEERGGPRVESPQRRGFGRALIEHAAGYELAGSARLEFRPAGVSYALNVPLDRLVSRVM